MKFNFRIKKNIWHLHIHLDCKTKAFKIVTQDDLSKKRGVWGWFQCTLSWPYAIDYLTVQWLQPNRLYETKPFYERHQYLAQDFYILYMATLDGSNIYAHKLHNWRMCQAIKLKCNKSVHSKRNRKWWGMNEDMLIDLLEMACTVYLIKLTDQLLGSLQGFHHLSNKK